MKQLIFILLLALGLQTQAQVPPNITNIQTSQNGCMLDVKFDCVDCDQTIHMWFFRATDGRWIDIDVMRSSWATWQKNTLSIPLCTMDTSVYHSPGLICSKEGVTYRVTTEVNAFNFSGAKAWLTCRTTCGSYSGHFTLPVIASPDCGGAAPPEPVMATPAKKGGKKK